jgi:hypothetical protein
MIQRQKNNQRSRDTAVHLVQKKFLTQKSASNVMVSVFWDKDGILVVDYLEKGATITAR